MRRTLGRVCSTKVEVRDGGWVFSLDQDIADCGRGGRPAATGGVGKALEARLGALSLPCLEGPAEKGVTGEMEEYGGGACRE
jgi:hypothetical protein